MSSHGHEKRQGDRRQPSDFKKYRDFCPASISDDTLQGIIRKHKDKREKDDLILADIEILLDSNQCEESWQSTGKQKKKKESSQPGSDRVGGRGRGRDGRSSSQRGSGGGRGNGPVVRRDTPRPKSTELPSSTIVNKPEPKSHTESVTRSSSLSSVSQKEKAEENTKVGVLVGGAWANNGMNLAEKMKSDLQKKEDSPAPLLAPKPVVAAPQFVEPASSSSSSSNRKSTPDSTSTPPPSSQPSHGGKKGRSKKGKANNIQKSSEETIQDVEKQSKASSIKETDQVIRNEEGGAVMDDLFVTGTAMKINKQEIPVSSSTDDVNSKHVEDITKSVSTPQRKPKTENVMLSPCSPKGVILGNFEVEDDAAFSFGNFGEESPDRRVKGKGNKGIDEKAVVATEVTTTDLSMDSFMGKHLEVSTPSSIAVVSSAPSTESFSAVGSLTSTDNNGPPGFESTSSTAASNKVPIQQPTSTKSSRKGKGNKDHNQHQNQDPFGQSTPNDMHNQQSQQQRNNAQNQAPVGSLAGLPMYSADGGAGFINPTFMGGSYDSLYGGNMATSKTSGDAVTHTGNNSTPTVTSGNNNSGTNSSPLGTSTPQGQSNQGQGQQQAHTPQGYTPSNQLGMGQMGAHYYPYPGPYYPNPYFYGGQQPPPNFYGGRGGQNIYPSRVPYPDAFGGGGQGMAYDIYNHGQGGQYDSAALNYNQQLQHMHSNQQHYAQQQGGNEGNSSKLTNMESGNSSRHKNNKNSGNVAGGNVGAGQHGNLLHDNTHHNFGTASGGVSGQFMGSRQDPQQQYGNMYMHQNSFHPMMPHFSQPSANSPVPNGGGLSGSSGGAGYSQMGGASGFSNRGGSGGNNYNTGNNRGGNSNQVPSASSGNPVNAPSSTAPSNW